MRRAPLALLALLGACDFLHDPTRVEVGGQVVVHAMLAAGAEEAAVLLTVTGTRDSLGISATGPLSGAEVELSVPGRTVRLSEAPAGFRPCLFFFGGGNGPQGAAGPGCYAARVPEGIRAGERYGLRIRLPEGREIVGEARVPLVPEVLSPAPRARIVLRPPRPDFLDPDSLRVGFRLPDGAAGGGVFLLPRLAFERGRAVPDAVCQIAVPLLVLEHGGNATFSLPVYFVSCSRREGSTTRPLALDSVQARLLVTAYDSAYIRYLPVLQEEALQASVVAQGVAGAYGLFAGEATAEQPITVVPQPGTR